jgi:hypothetical protein
MKKQKLKGRPTINQDDKKQIKITVKFSQKEYANLIEKVRLAQVKTISEFVREAIFIGQIKERFSVEQLSCIRKIAGMANNLNQLAREAHVYGIFPISENCTNICKKIDNLLKEIK